MLFSQGVPWYRTLTPPVIRGSAVVSQSSPHPPRSSLSKRRGQRGDPWLLSRDKCKWDQAQCEELEKQSGVPVAGFLRLEHSSLPSGKSLLHRNGLDWPQRLTPGATLTLNFTFTQTGTGMTSKQGPGLSAVHSRLLPGWPLCHRQGNWGWA